MAHLSENPIPLEYSTITLHDSSELATLDTSHPDVWCIVLPFVLESAPEKEKVLIDHLASFSQKLHQDSLLTILTTPEQAANIYLHLKSSVKFQLWIVVKLHRPICREGCLPVHHAALLVLSKYRGSLKHTKTRISYTYCPTCERTTKDYGGKKHLYHKYGTLMSDIWRDISYNPQGEPEDIIARLQDLFGISSHNTLHVIDLRAQFHAATKVSDLTVNYLSTFEDHHDAIIHDSQLINQDCLVALQDIPSEGVDFCFADPPYNIDKKYDSWDDTLDIQEYFHWCDTWLSELARVLKPGRMCAILNIPLWAIRHFAHMQTNLQFYDWIVWEGLSLPVRMIMPSHYTILAFSKGTPRELPGLYRKTHTPLEADSMYTLKENFCSRASCVRSRKRAQVSDKEPATNLWWDIHRLKHNSRRVDHPTQLPPKLMHRLIALFTNEGEIVLDPFNGSGTTSLTAEQLHRKFIGIELSSSYYELAQKRHHELRNGVDPFRKNDIIPTAKNSRVKRLKKQKYDVSKKTLQLEIKKIANKLGRIPTRNEVKIHSTFPLKYYDEYFINWGEVCAAARTTGMTEQKHPDTKPHIKKEQLSLFDRKS
jgi:DNA modification methylase